MVLTFNSTDPDLISNTFNLKLEIVNNWFINKKIKVNHSMSKFILFSYRRNLILPNINLGNNIISETDSTKIPGIIIDKKLKKKIITKNIIIDKKLLIKPMLIKFATKFRSL